MRSSDQRNSIITSKRNARDKALAFAGPYLVNDHDVYTKATASEIVQRIAKGEWTSSQVLEAYIARSAMAQAETNFLYEDARKQAKELDAEFASTKVLRGPFHGVPVSFKDQYTIEGYDATIGFTAWANKPGTKDAFVVTQFRAAGAIIFVKTNVPQTMFAFECSNPLWGRTTNPWNNKFTSGGSSGGEGALLAMDGSALGIGSDIGGSLRIPASFCGIYSMKPSGERVSSFGIQGCRPGYEAIRSCLGPLARSVEDCELFCKTIFGQKDPAHQNIPLPYQPVELSSKLRFGYYLSDGLLESSPACKRAVLETVSALRKQGHECIEFASPLHTTAMEVFLGLASSDGYKKMLSYLDSDPMAITLGPRLPSFVRNLACWITKTFLGDSLFSRFFSAAREKSVLEFTDLTDGRNKVNAAWYEQVWDKYNFDGIIAPVQSLPAIPHGGTTYLAPLAAATIMFNVIDSPVGTIPVTRVNPDTDQLPADFVAGASGRSKMLDSRMYLGKNPVYDPKAMEGMPIGVQIVGKRWEDEKVLAMMHVVDEALGPRGFGPGNWTPRKTD
ncbi:amidase signature domain-containing protein [Suillus clintonianus]|uniref:amidase signature domain-containing protein n=1 Tax=Suillus clintonianus TaxID=1904413 RepID=UPI001B886497|nr:amidase signature domain-containing protein [Suillus clintonianus]KAG2132990.1 amidase signature domain-containing protein [Suillus clintonianus]